MNTAIPRAPPLHSINGEVKCLTQERHLEARARLYSTTSQEALRELTNNLLVLSSSRPEGENCSPSAVIGQ